MVAAGKTRSAQRAVSVRKLSTTTVISIDSRARATVADSGSIATGLPAVTQTKRYGGSDASSRPGPINGSGIERGAVFKPPRNESSNGARRATEKDAPPPGTPRLPLIAASASSKRTDAAPWVRRCTPQPTRSADGPSA